MILKKFVNNGNCSPMSDSAWCDLSSKGVIIELHDMCSKPKCKSQEQINFTPEQFQLECTGFKKENKKFYMNSSCWEMNP